MFSLSSVCLAVVCSTLATQGSDASAPQAADTGGPVTPASSDGRQGSPEEDGDKLATDVEQDETGVDLGRTPTSTFSCFFMIFSY